MVEFCKKIKCFLKKINLFGISFSFKYNSEEEYKSAYGGIVTVIFFLLWTLSFIINSIPFVKNYNYTLDYYTMNSKKSDAITIKLNEFSTDFAFGLKCEDDNDNNITKRANELFDLELKFYNKSKDNPYNYRINTHYCNTKDDFYNITEEIFKDLEISKLKCMNKDEKIENIEGIYTDEVFTYYTLTLSLKEKNNTENLNNITEFLLHNDCKIQFYYKDITTSLSDYNKPITYFVNSLFLQINPHLYTKKNIFFMNYRFENQNSILKGIKIFKNESEEYYTGFSRVEDYFLYKSLNRSNGISDHEKYAKIFIRADNKLIEIRREYQDFLEFYADATSLLEDVFIILNLIITFIDKYKAERSIIKKLFFEHTKDYKCKIFNKKELNISTETSFPKISDNDILDEITINTNINNNNDINIKKNDKFNSMPYIYTTRKSITRNNFITSSDKDSRRNIRDSVKTLNTRIEKEKAIKKNKFSISTFLMIIFDFLCCKCYKYCKNKKKESKHKIIEQCKDIFDEKLDIFRFIRNMILLELIYGLLVDDKNKKCINYLSRSLIYLHNEGEENKKNDEEDFYESSEKLKSEELVRMLKQLDEKSNKTEIEEKIISLIKK